MRKLFIGAAAAMVIAAPGVASANGYVGLDYANVDVDGAGSEDGFGVSGSVVLTPNIALDAAVADNDGDTGYGVTGHLFTNNSAYLLGAFAGISGADSDGGDDSTTWEVGGEGQYYMNNVTLAGAVTYANNDDADLDIWGVNGEARYFVSENFRLQGGLGWFNYDNGVGDDSAVNIGLGGEYLFAAAPVSVGLGYLHTEFDEADISGDALTATVRYNFGGGSLLDRDRSGGGLAGLSGVTSGLGF